MNFTYASYRGLLTLLWEEGYALHSWENEDTSHEPYTENTSEIVY